MNKDISNVVEGLEVKRLHKALDSIETKLGFIETQLIELVKVQEQMKFLDQTMSRHSMRLENHDMRLRETETWQAQHGDRTNLDRIVTHIQDDLSELRHKVDHLDSDVSENKGHKDVVKEILKWAAGIMAAFIIYLMTKQNGP